MSQTEVQLIKDAVIVNADVSNSAAIDVSKLSGVMPLAGGTFTGDILFQSDSGNILFDKSDNALEFSDNNKAKFGNSADFEIYHNGASNNTEVNHTNNSSHLQITSNRLKLMNYDGPETYIDCISNGSVSLYHDNSKKFETTSAGAQLTGSLAFMSESTNISLLDNGKAKFGNGDDLQIFHNGNHSFITDSGTGNLFVKTSKLAVENAAGNESLLSATQDGAVELFHNGTKKFDTTSSGIDVTGSVTADDLITINGASTAEYRITTSENNRLLIRSTSSLCTIITQNNNSLSLRHDGGTGSGTEILKMTSSGVQTGNNKDILIKDFYGDTSGRIVNSDSGANSLAISVDPDDSGSNSILLIQIDGSTKARFTSDGFIPNGSDTAAVNALDDYEEGTFTPTSSAVTLTGTIAGHYTKIGDLVTVQMIFVVPSTSNTSDIEIDGLPFNGKNGTDGSYIQGGFVTYHNQGGGPYTALIANNMNRIVVYKADGNRQTFNQFSGKNLRLAAVYKVA